MGMLDRVLKEHIFIDFGVEPSYGSDQMDVDHPHRFATVTFELMGSALLEEMADRIRTKNGYRPMHSGDGFADKDCDLDCWYDFSYGISEHGGDSCILFTVVNSESEDNLYNYAIDLTDEESQAMYARMEQQCRGYLGKSCADLLAEAREEMECEDHKEGREGSPV